MAVHSTRYHLQLSGSAPAQLIARDGSYVRSSSLRSRQFLSRSSLSKIDFLSSSCPRMNDSNRPSNPELDAVVVLAAVSRYVRHLVETMILFQTDHH
jgi:hypothetical protein